MLFLYKALTKSGQERNGSIDAISEDVAIGSLQRRELVVVSIQEEGKKGSIFEMDIAFLSKVSSKEIVMLSRQIATLFDAQVPALRTFQLLASESDNNIIKRKFVEIGDDIQGGMAISGALNKHPSVFSNFYVNMVRSGEESGKLSEVFLYLADYLERSQDLIAKTRSALIYPTFAISVFLIVMVLLMTVVIPKIGAIVTDSGQELPIYTKIVLGISSFMISYGLFIVAGIAIAGYALWYYNRKGVISFSKIQLQAPLLGPMFKKLYLSRIADNMNTMLTSGIPMIRAVEITSDVVGNKVYKEILDLTIEKVKAGEPLSKALSGYDEFPNIMLQMIRVGEETGELGNILQKMAVFYKREVDTAVETMVSLIEPVLIVFLGLGVGTVLAAVLMPIYNIAGSL